MIAYEDLVSALSSWRAGQGLPPNTVHFASAVSGSVDLALPLADPIETLGTGEVEALGDDYVSADEYAVVDEYSSVESEADADLEDTSYAASTSEHDVLEESNAEMLVGNSLDYGDDDESEQTAIASDFESQQSDDEGASELAAFQHADSDMDAMSSSDGQAEVAADDLEVEEESVAPPAYQVEPHTEEVEMLGEEFSEDEQEVPTKFGDLEAESTVMGIGIDELQRPGPATDPEE